MQILNNLLAAFFGGGEATPDTAVPGEFQFMLDGIPVEGAPPGPPPECPPPPGEKVAGKEVAIQWPIAETQRLDFLPQTRETAAVVGEAQMADAKAAEDPLTSSEADSSDDEPSVEGRFSPVIPIALATVALPLPSVVAAVPVSEASKSEPKSVEALAEPAAAQIVAPVPTETARAQSTGVPKVKHHDHAVVVADQSALVEKIESQTEPVEIPAGVPTRPVGHKEFTVERAPADTHLQPEKSMGAQPQNSAPSQSKDQKTVLSNEVEVSPEAKQVNQILTELKATEVIQPTSIKQVRVVEAEPKAVKDFAAKEATKAQQTSTSDKKAVVESASTKIEKPVERNAELRTNPVEQAEAEAAPEATNSIKAAPKQNSNSDSAAKGDDEQGLELLEKKPAKDDVKQSGPFHAEVVKKAQEVSVEKPVREITATDLKAVIKQITDRIEILAARPREAVTIHLKPEDLGTITLTVKAVGNVIDTQIAASDQGVRQALEQSHTHLAASLEQRGFTVNQISVSNTSGLNTETHARHQQQNHQHQHQPNQQARQSTTHSFGTNVPTDPAQVRQLVRKASGVDLWI